MGAPQLLGLPSFYELQEGSTQTRSWLAFLMVHVVGDGGVTRGITTVELIQTKMGPFGEEVRWDFGSR